MRLVGNLHAELLLGLFLRGAGAVSSFVLVWMIARSFGADVVGLFQVALATATLAAIIVTQGLDRIIVRAASVAISEKRFADAAEAFRRARRRLLAVGALVVIGLVLGAEPFAERILGEPRAAPFLWLLAPVSLAIALIRLCASLLRSRGRVLLSQSLDGVGYTTIAAALVGAAILIARPDWILLPPIAYLIGTLAILAVAWWQCQRMIRDWGESSAALPLKAGLYVATFNALSSAGDWTGLMLLTAAEGAAIAGVFRVAFQITLLFTIVNTSFAVMIGPRVAAAGARGDRLSVRRTVRSAGLLGTAICLPLFVVALVWPEPILRLFGGDFVAGADALRILAVAQLINVATGPVGASLTMLHRERTVLLIEFAAFALGLAVIVLALPDYGMLALAAGTAVSSAVRNCASYVALRRHLAGFGGRAQTAAD